jgi:hypothetical protein
MGSPDPGDVIYYEDTRFFFLAAHGGERIEVRGGFSCGRFCLVLEIASASLALALSLPRRARRTKKLYRVSRHSGGK